MRRLSNLLLPVLLLSSSLCFARASDDDQPINIEADSVEIREQQGISIYRGSVKISRGSMIIKGELITIHNTPQGLEKIVVEGKPASFRQLTDMDEEISAQSLEMTYVASNGLLVMKKQAILVQKQNKFTSEHIIYDTRKDIVQAGENSTSGDSETPQRVTITIQPEKDDQQNSNEQKQ